MSHVALNSICSHDEVSVLTAIKVILQCNAVPLVLIDSLGHQKLLRVLQAVCDNYVAHDGSLPEQTSPGHLTAGLHSNAFLTLTIPAMLRPRRHGHDSPWTD